MPGHVPGNWQPIRIFAASIARAPTRHGIEANAELLARYAAMCQAEGLVPIVEPEVLMDGDHEIDRHAAVTEAVQHAVFHALHRHHVVLELMLLEPNMVLAGKDCRRAEPQELAQQALLRRAHLNHLAMRGAYWPEMDR